jgi:hypothetical protein
MSCCCIFDTKETSIDNTEPNIRTPIIIFGYEEILPYMNIKCLICNEKVCDILVYCYSCKSSLGHEYCVKTLINCRGCNKDISKFSRV